MLVRPSPPSSAERKSKKGPIQCLTQVFKCDNKLTRYNYNKRYTVPILERCKELFPDVCCKTAAFKEVTLYLFAKSDNELEEYTKYMPGGQMKECQLSSVLHDVRRDDAEHPVVLAIPTHQKQEILQRLTDLAKAVIILFFNSSQASRPTSKGENRMPRGVITSDTTLETFCEDLDRTLERYLFSFLKQFADKQWSKAHERLSDLRTEIQASFERSDVPKHEYPSKTFQLPEPPLSDELKRHLFKELKEVSAVVGYGFRNHVLHIDIDKTVLDRETIKQTLNEVMSNYQIIQYEFSFVGKEIQDFIECGDCLYGSQGNVTLGCFAKSNGSLYALTSEHFRANPYDNNVYIRNGQQLGNIIAFSDRRQYDIAAIKINEMFQHVCRTALKDEDGIFLTITCALWNQGNVQLPLPVYIYGGQSRPGKGRLIAIGERIDGYTATFLVIESISEDDFCCPGDSGSIVIARPNHMTYLLLGMVKGRLKRGDQYTNEYVAIDLHDCVQSLRNILGNQLDIWQN